MLPGTCRYVIVPDGLKAEAKGQAMNAQVLGLGLHADRASIPRHTAPAFLFDAGPLQHIVLACNICRTASSRCKRPSTLLGK